MDPNLSGSELIQELEKNQEKLVELADRLRPFKEGRTERSRAVAVAITNLDQARLWLGEAIMEEPH